MYDIKDLSVKTVNQYKELEKRTYNYNVKIDKKVSELEIKSDEIMAELKKDVNNMDLLIDYQATTSAISGLLDSKANMLEILNMVAKEVHSIN